MPFRNLQNSSRGFTLTEILVVLGIMGLFAAIMLFGVGTGSRGGAARDQVRQTLVSHIRRAQSMSLAGSTSGGVIVCGYGISQIDQRSYRLYAKKPLNASTTCAATRGAIGTNFVPSNDIVVEVVSLDNPNVQIIGAFQDVLFEIPGPTTYINNQSGTAASPTRISIAPTGDSASAKDITIHPSGRLDIEP